MRHGCEAKAGAGSRLLSQSPQTLIFLLPHLNTTRATTLWLRDYMSCVTLEKSPSLVGPHLQSGVDPPVLQTAVRTHGYPCVRVLREALGLEWTLYNTGFCASA